MVGGAGRLGVIGVLAGAFRSGGHVAEASTAGIDAALAVIGVTMAVTTVFGNLGEIGENNRFRFIVEPVMFVVLAWVTDRMIRLGRRARAGHDREVTTGPEAAVPVKSGIDAAAVA